IFEWKLCFFIAKKPFFANIAIVFIFIRTILLVHNVQHPFYIFVNDDASCFNQLNGASPCCGNHKIHQAPGAIPSSPPSTIEQASGSMKNRQYWHSYLQRKGGGALLRYNASGFRSFIYLVQFQSFL
ncbi:hypothetical protein KA005_08530, partial [bacterium]|nr:hypothetical protein [bacterium]